MLTLTHFKFCPACGKKDISTIVGNAMRCVSCGLVYYHNTAAAVAGIIEVRGKVILVKRNQSPKKGLLDLPGGFVDYGESAEDALAREIKEELGVTMNSCRYFASFSNRYRYKGITYRTCDLFYLCTVERVPDASHNEEVAGITLVKPAAIDFERIALASIRNALEKYAAYRR
jgi:NAD+ diphosphatase